jgi:DNA repair exonuclease SbcCD ATPase subunit
LPDTSAKFFDGKGLRIMLKKIAVATLAVVGGLFILNSTHLGAYARTALHKIKATAKKQVPLEFQLESIRNEAAQLIPEMKNHLTAIAGETVAIQNLREEIVDIRTHLDKQKDNLRTMNDELKSGEQKVSFNGRVYSADRMREIVARNLESCKRCTDELKAKESLLEAKERSLDVAREQLGSMRSQKEQLEVQIAQMEAELKTLRLAQCKSNFHLDDSRLTRIKAALQDVRTEIRVQEKAAELFAAWEGDGSTIESKKPVSNAQVTKETDDFLGESRVAEKR